MEDFDIMQKITECGQTSFGLDYGFGNDPTAFVAVAIDEEHKKLWIYDEMYAHHQTTPQTAEWIINHGYQNAHILADSANPERTQQLVDIGIINADSVQKTRVEAGIDQLWQYQIYVHPHCKNIWNEFNNYVFDTDKIGNTLNVPKDENNHAIDALRYAMRPFMQNYDNAVSVKWSEQYRIGEQMGVNY